MISVNEDHFIYPCKQQHRTFSPVLLNFPSALSIIQYLNC